MQTGVHRDMLYDVKKYCLQALSFILSILHWAFLLVLKCLHHTVRRSIGIAPRVSTPWSSWAPGVLARANGRTDGCSSIHPSLPLQIGLCPLWVDWEERVKRARWLAGGAPVFWSRQPFLAVLPPRAPEYCGRDFLLVPCLCGLFREGYAAMAWHEEFPHTQRAEERVTKSTKECLYALNCWGKAKD